MTGFAGVALGVGALLVGFAAPHGNGIEDDPPRVIIEKGRQTLVDAKSVRMVAQVVEASGTTGLDLHFDVDGNCTGTVTPPGNAGRAELVKRGQDVWLKPDAKFLQAQMPGPAGQDAAEVINGRWIHGNAGNPELRDFAEVCDLSVFQDAYVSKPLVGKPEKGVETKVDGKPAVTATSRTGAESTTYYVATEGKPYLLRIEGTKAGQKGKATFSDYDKPVPAKTPTKAESVELSSLN
ncbi:hypothetical protein [Streptomyces sp. NPDC089799]|uniref:hypothetical protein n=1 Tax=Streptomyces sp. NPDC089799 TaxID=3155066 RepID=UPI003412B093